MDQAEARRLRKVLSRARIEEYERACGGDLVAALRLNCWNTEASEAFHGPLEYLEIALRNAIDDAMEGILGRDDWWSSPHLTLHEVANGKLAEAKQEAARRGKASDRDCVIVELAFGFWVSLLGPGRGYEVRLWRPGLHRAFPEFRGRRRDLHKELDYLRLLRNRIAHHRPIYHRHLAADHETILRVTGYISPELASRVRQHSRVPEVLARHPLHRGAAG